jgi:hypothetical protein
MQAARPASANLQWCFLASGASAAPSREQRVILMSQVVPPGDSDFLSGGGEMGARMRAFDWTTTPLVSPDGWPQHLKSAVALCLGSRFPSVIWWGRDTSIQFYNDRYSTQRTTHSSESSHSASVPGVRWTRNTARSST